MSLMIHSLLIKCHYFYIEIIITFHISIIMVVTIYSPISCFEYYHHIFESLICQELQIVERLQLKRTMHIVCPFKSVTKLIISIVVSIVLFPLFYSLHFPLVLNIVLDLTIFPIFQSLLAHFFL